MSGYLLRIKLKILWSVPELKKNHRIDAAIIADFLVLKSATFPNYSTIVDTISYTLW